MALREPLSPIAPTVPSSNKKRKVESFILTVYDPVRSRVFKELENVRLFPVRALLYIVPPVKVKVISFRGIPGSM